MQFIIDCALILSYIFLVVLVFSYITRFWVMYVQQQFLNNEVNGKSILLEIKLPREIDKSPQAFELIAANLMQTGGVGTWYDRKIKGNLSLWFSLEIVSIEGVVHFYIWGHKKFKSLIESNLYSQYPGVEVIEVDDYTGLFRYEHNKSKYGMWGNEYKLNSSWETNDKKFNAEKKKDEPYKMPKDFLPLRTYVDLGLDKNPKEEYKNDPLTSILEAWGSLGKGEYAGLQLLIQDESNFDKKFPATYLNEVTHEHLTFGKLAQAWKDKLRNKRTVKAGDQVIDNYGNPALQTKIKDDGKAERVPLTYGAEKELQDKESDLTIEEKNELELVNRKLSKPVARCVLRAIYITKEGVATAPFPNRIQQYISLFRQFNAPGFNVLGPFKFADPYGFPWENFMQKRTPWRKEEIFDAYIEREGFYPHTGLVKSLGDTTFDVFFFPFKGYVRKTFNLVVEGLLHPFGHPHPSEVFCLNTEEIATIFHFPGVTASVPTLPRIDSAKAEAPVNLPQ